MQVDIVKKETHFVEVKISDLDFGLANAIRMKLLEDSDVTFASAVQRHPDVPSIEMVVRTKSKNAYTALKSAVSDVKKSVAKFASEL